MKYIFKLTLGGIIQTEYGAMASGHRNSSSVDNISTDAEIKRDIPIPKLHICKGLLLQSMFT